MLGGSRQGLDYRPRADGVKDLKFRPCLAFGGFSSLPNPDALWWDDRDAD
jgi:hypothetical protein